MYIFDFIESIEEVKRCTVLVYSRFKDVELQRNSNVNQNIKIKVSSGYEIV